MKACIFCDIINQTETASIVYEDAEFIAFMDTYPLTEGHCLVIPKTPCRNILDATDTQLAAVMVTVKKVANAAKLAFDADGITLQQFSEAAGGQEVFHLHFHIHPRHADVAMRAPGQMGDMDVIKANAQKILEALA